MVSEKQKLLNAAMLGRYDQAICGYDPSTSNLRYLYTINPKRRAQEMKVSRVPVYPLKPPKKKKLFEEPKQKAPPLKKTQQPAKQDFLDIDITPPSSPDLRLPIQKRPHQPRSPRKIKSTRAPTRVHHAQSKVSLQPMQPESVPPNKLHVPRVSLRKPFAKSSPIDMHKTMASKKTTKVQFVRLNGHGSSTSSLRNEEGFFGGPKRDGPARRSKAIAAEQSASRPISAKKVSSHARQKCRQTLSRLFPDLNTKTLDSSAPFVTRNKVVIVTN